jgi:hypothetical protein
MTVQFLPQHRPSAYRITATRLHEYSIAFDIEPADRESEPIYLRGSATPGSLELKMGGAARLKWERELFLETEEAVLGRIKAVSERAAAMERDGSW